MRDLPPAFVFLWILALPLALWALLWSLSPSKLQGERAYWQLDPDSNSPWSFLPLYEIYRRWIDRILVLAALGWYFTRSQSGRASFEFAASVVSGLVFLGALAWFYERYMGERFSLGTAKNYSTARASFVMAFGFATIIQFVLGIAAAVR